MNKMTFLIVIILTASAAAQTRTITVVGEAEVSERANIAEFTVTLRKDGKTLEGAYAEVQKYSNSIVSDLLKTGLDSNSIQQSRLRVDEKLFKLFSTNKIEAVIRLKVILSDLTLLEKALAIFNRAEVDDVSDIHYRLRDDFALKQRALSLATANAVKSAAALATEHKLSLVKIISIEDMTNPISDVRTTEYEYQSSKSGWMYTTSSFPEIVYLRRHVKVVYEIQ